MSFVDISQIRDIRTGETANIPKDPRLKVLVADPHKAVTIVVAPDFVQTKFINFITTKPEVAKVSFNCSFNLLVAYVTLLVDYSTATRLSAERNQL